MFDDSDIPVFFVQGLVLVLSGVALGRGQRRPVPLAQQTAVRSRAAGVATRLGLANPLAKRFRTGLLLGMYALIVFVLVFMAVFAAVFQAQAPRITADTSAGYDMRVDSSLGNPVTAVQLQARRRGGAGRTAGAVRSPVPGRLRPRHRPATADRVRRIAARSEAPGAVSRDPRFGTDAARGGRCSAVA